MTAVGSVKAGSRAGDGNDAGDARRDPRCAQYPRRHAARALRGDELSELRSLYEAIERADGVVTQGFIGEEEESSVPAELERRGRPFTKTRNGERSADAAAVLILVLVVPHGPGVVEPAVLVKGVQPRTIVLEKETTMKSISAIL